MTEFTLENFFTPIFKISLALSLKVVPSSFTSFVRVPSGSSPR